MRTAGGTTNDQRPRDFGSEPTSHTLLSGLNRNFTERGGNIPYHSYGQRHLCEKGSSTGGLLPTYHHRHLAYYKFFEVVGKRVDNCRTQQKLIRLSCKPNVFRARPMGKSKTLIPNGRRQDHGAPSFYCKIEVVWYNNSNKTPATRQSITPPPPTASILLCCIFIYWSFPTNCGPFAFLHC